MDYLYHVTTTKLARRYRETGYIKPPVRGFDTLQGAMAGAIKVGRPVIYKLDVRELDTYKLPDHHNKFGTAYWADGKVHIFKHVPLE